MMNQLAMRAGLGVEKEERTETETDECQGEKQGSPIFAVLPTVSHVLQFPCCRSLCIRPAQ